VLARAGQVPTQLPKKKVTQDELDFLNGSYSVPSFRVSLLTFGVSALTTVVLLILHARLAGLIIGLLGFGFSAVTGLRALSRKRVLPNPPLVPELNEDATREQILRRDFTRFRYTESTEDDGEKALTQLKQLEDRLKNYHRLLLEKLNQEELTFHRYFEAAVQTKIAVLDHLTQISELIRSLSSPAMTGIEEKIGALPKVSSTEEEKLAAKNLQDRLQVREEEKAQLQRLFAFNEQALIEIERITLAISKMRNLDTASSPRLETALQELEELTKRASKY